MGQVICKSDDHATKATTTPYRPQHMMATIMHSLFDLGQVRLIQSLPNDLKNAITECDPHQRNNLKFKQPLIICFNFKLITFQIRSDKLSSLSFSLYNTK